MNLIGYWFFALVLKLSVLFCVKQPISGGYEPYKGDVEAQEPNDQPPSVSFAAAGFSDVLTRAVFVQKVYYTLSVQFGIALFIKAVFDHFDSVKIFILENPYLNYVSYAVFLMSYLVLACCQGLRTKSPANAALLLMFTLALSVMTGVTSVYYSTNIISMALGIIFAVTMAVSIFASQTKYDFTKWLGVAVVGSFCLLFFAIFLIFVHDQLMHLVYAGIGAVFFTVFLAIDTQMIVGGKRQNINPEEHILGAIMLLTDIIYIFQVIMYILRRS